MSVKECAFCGISDGHLVDCRLRKIREESSATPGVNVMTPEEHWNFLGALWGEGANDPLRELHDPDMCLKCAEGEAIANKRESVTGQTIVAVRWMTAAEADGWFGWDRRGIVLELENGMVLCASQDDEGNGVGAMFAFDRTGDEYQVWEEAGPYG